MTNRVFYCRGLAVCVMLLYIVRLPFVGPSNYPTNATIGTGICLDMQCLLGYLSKGKAQENTPIGML